MKALTKRQKLFVAEYIACNFNATEAAKKAGYSEKTAYAIGQRLSKKVEIVREIDKLLDEIIQDRKVLAVMWVNAQKEIAFSMIEEGEDGKLAYEYPVAERQKALKAIAKFLNLYTPEKNRDNIVNAEELKIFFNKEKARLKIAKKVE